MQGQAHGALPYPLHEHKANLHVLEVLDAAEDEGDVRQGRRDSLEKFERRGGCPGRVKVACTLPSLRPPWTQRATWRSIEWLLPQPGIEGGSPGEIWLRVARGENMRARSSRPGTISCTSFCGSGQSLKQCCKQGSRPLC